MPSSNARPRQMVTGRCSTGRSWCGDVADRHDARAEVAVDDAQHEAAQVAHVAGVGAAQQQVADRALELRRLAIRMRLRGRSAGRAGGCPRGDRAGSAGAGCSRRSGSRSRCGRCRMPCSAARSRLVAQTSRKALLRQVLLPTRLNVPSWMTRSSSACRGTGSSPTSSRKSVPPSASSKAPARGGGRAGERALLVAEELAARTATARPCCSRAPPAASCCGRGSSSWMSCATRSFPVPLSPVISTAASVNRATSTASRSTARQAGLSPTRKLRTWRHSTSSSIVCQRRRRSATCRAVAVGPARSRRTRRRGAAPSCRRRARLRLHAARSHSRGRRRRRADRVGCRVDVVGEQDHTVARRAGRVPRRCSAHARRPQVAYHPLHGGPGCADHLDPGG